MIKFLVKSGEESRELEIADTTITLGRSSENLIALADKKASRKHALIEKVGEEYRITDLGSGNGTRINGREIQTYSLAKGDEIHVGLSTVYVLDLDTPPVAAPAAVAPTPVLAAVAPAPLAPAPAAPEAAPKREITRRVLAPRRSSSGRLVAVAAVLCMIGAVAYGGVYFASMRPKISMSDSGRREEKKGQPSVREAEAAYKTLDAKASTVDQVTDPLVAEAGDLTQKFGGVYPQFEALLARLKQRRADHISKMTFAEVETLVAMALREKRYGDAIEALKALRNGNDAAKAATFLAKVNEEVDIDFKSVEEYGKKLVDQNQYKLAAEHYQTQAPRFRDTKHYKYLYNKPANLEDMALAELAAAKARDEKPANAPAPKPPTEIAKAPPREPPVEAPKPAPKDTAKPAPEKKPKEMAKPAPKPPEPPKPAPKPPPEPPKPAAKPPEPPKPKEEGAKSAFKKPDALCACKKTVKGVFCVKCDRVLEQDDLRRNVCKRCEEPPKKIDICVRRLFRADCHPEKVDYVKPVSWWGKVYDFPAEDRARVVWYCETCEDTGDSQYEVKHKADCSNKSKVIKVCMKSGIPPHLPEK